MPSDTQALVRISFQIQIPHTVLKSSFLRFITSLYTLSVVHRRRLRLYITARRWGKLGLQSDRILSQQIMHALILQLRMERGPPNRISARRSDRPAVWREKDFILINVAFWLHSSSWWQLRGTAMRNKGDRERLISACNICAVRYAIRLTIPPFRQQLSFQYFLLIVITIISRHARNAAWYFAVLLIRIDVYRVAQKVSYYH